MDSPPFLGIAVINKWLSTLLISTTGGRFPRAVRRAPVQGLTWTRFSPQDKAVTRTAFAIKSEAL